MNRKTILESKILIPDICQDYEQRVKLLSELQAEAGKLLVLCAAVGYGKTVLMSQYAGLPGHICAWYHLDPPDNELMTFVRYLELSLDKALGGFHLEEELYREAESGAVCKLGRHLIMELTERLKGLEDRRLVLALDDLQVLKNPEILKLLGEILENTDHRFLLIAATKDAMPDPFVKYLMRYQGTLIGAERLRLEKAEVRGILTRLLSESDAKRHADMIWTNTEGWPAGVMLAALYLKLQDDVQAVRYAVMAGKAPKSEGPLLQVDCFGKFRVVIAETGKEISWRTRKAMELFAYLIDLEGKPVERRVLLERLWPDEAPNNEVPMLHNMIYSIRKELSAQPKLKDLIQYKGHQYCLNRSLIKTDLDSKKQICKLAETGRVKELYDRREELLRPWGVYLKEVDGIWCMSRRTYFERSYGKACSLLAGYCRAIGDSETEISCWNAYMAADRYSEEAIAGLLRCYADMGERSQMQRVFETGQKIFKEEMGVEMSPEIIRIYEQGMKRGKVEKTFK